MRKGYSNLLGEYVDAAHICYTDCKSFQIVCPNCREPVFKVMRDGETALHYLSHYAADKAFAADCELRVGSLESHHLEQHNHLSREQRLRYFLSVLRKTVTDSFYTVGKEKLPSVWKQMSRAKAITWMRETAFSYVCEHRAALLDDFGLFAESYVGEGIGSEDPVWSSGFSMQVQTRIARDMMASLTTAPGRDNFHWLWNHAYCFLQTRLEVGRRVGTQTPPILAIERYMARLQFCSKSEGFAILSEMANARMYPPEVVDPGFPMLSKVFAEISHEMVGCLIRLPYFELLREAKL